MKIRKMKKSELKDVIVIAKALPKWFTPLGLRAIRRACKNQYGFVAIDKNKLLGFIIYRKWKTIAEITWMGVHSNYHRKGIGKRLMRSVENELRGKVNSLKISTVAHTVKYGPYSKTRKFYKKIGFKNHRIDKGFYAEFTKHGIKKNSVDRLVLLKKL